MELKLHSFFVLSLTWHLMEKRFAIIFNFNELIFAQKYIFICKCGVVKKPTQTKQNQKSCIQNTRCTCVKTNIVYAAKYRCMNCGNSKLSIQSVKKRKLKLPLLTTTLSSQTSMKYLLNSREKTGRSWITSFQHFILESILCITLKDLNDKLGMLGIEFLKKEVHECYEKLLEKLERENLLEDQEHKRVDWKTSGK